MQFVLLVCSSSEFAFRIQEPLERGEGYKLYNDTSARAHVSWPSCGWLPNPIVDGTPTPRIGHSGAPSGITYSVKYMWVLYLTSHKSQHFLHY
jgi:hypothetical protein